jgi:hypothetical protein
VLASVGELHVGADHELLDGGGDDDLTRPRERADASADVDCQAAEVLVSLDLLRLWRLPKASLRCRFRG